MWNGTLAAATAALALLPATGWAQGSPATLDNVTAQVVLGRMMQAQAQRVAAAPRFFATLSYTSAGSVAVLMEKVSPEAGYRVVAPNEVQAWVERHATGILPMHREQLLAGLTRGYRHLIEEVGSQLGGVDNEATLKLFDQTVLPFLKQGIVAGRPSRERPLSGPEWTRRQGEESARQGARDLEEVARLLKLEGSQRTSEGPAWYLAATALDRSLSPEFTLQQVRLWVHQEHFVPLRLQMIGEYRPRGQAARQVTIQKDSWDYVQVGYLYEPSLLRLSLSGLLGREDLAKVSEAKARMDEFKKRMAEMPAAQRKQVERMLGPQMRQLEEMARGGEVDLPVRILYFPTKKGAYMGLDALLAAYQHQVGTTVRILEDGVTPLTVEQ